RCSPCDRAFDLLWCRSRRIRTLPWVWRPGWQRQGGPVPPGWRVSTPPLGATAGLGAGMVVAVGTEARAGAEVATGAAVAMPAAGTIGLPGAPFALATSGIGGAGRCEV